MRARQTLRGLLEARRPRSRERGEIASALGLDARLLAEIEAEIASGKYLPRSKWAKRCRRLASDAETRARGENRRGGGRRRRIRDRSLSLGVFTDTGKLRAESQFGSAALRAEHPALFEQLSDERERLLNFGKAAGSHCP